MTGFAEFPQVDHRDAAGDLEATYDDIRLTPTRRKPLHSGQTLTPYE